jgi:hypothetical protein
VAFHDPLSYRFPEAEGVFDSDRGTAVATRRRVLDRLANEHLSVVGYHQPWPWSAPGPRFRYVAGD